MKLIQRLFLFAFAGTTLGLASMVAGAGTASASWDWCYDDPLVLVHGKVLDIQIGVPLLHLGEVNGPADVRIYVPRNVDATPLLNTSLLIKEKVTIVRTAEVWLPGRPVNVRVEVKVPATTSFDVSLLVTNQDQKTVAQVAQVFGKTNQYVVYKLQVGSILP